MFGREKLPVKEPGQLRSMRAAGLVVGQCLAYVREQAVSGTTTGTLDELAHTFIRDAGAIPSFLGYQGFPATLCISVNDQVVHGIPGERVLADGDLVSVDCGAIVDGWHGDAAVTFPVGDFLSAEDKTLTETTYDALWAGIAAFRPGTGIYELGAVIEDCVEAGAQRRRASGLQVNFGIVDGYTGHGIGTQMHMEPTVFNERVRPSGPTIREGATVAIEPMVTLGGFETHELDDGWTVLTDDGSRAAHWEHTVAATPGGLWVLTAIDGGAAELGAIGAPYTPLD